MQKSHSINTSLSQQMLDFLLKGKFINDLIFDNRFVELLAGIRGTQNQPKVLVFLRSCWIINSRDPFLLLIKILSLVVDQETVSHNLIFFAKSGLKGFCVSSQPLICHSMLDKDSIIDSNRLSSGLKPHIGVWVLEDPVCIVVVFQHENNFLKTRYLNKKLNTFENRLTD